MSDWIPLLHWKRNYFFCISELFCTCGFRWMHTQFQILIFNAFLDMISCLFLVLILPQLPSTFCWLLSKMVIVCCFFLKDAWQCNICGCESGRGFGKENKVLPCFDYLNLLIAYNFFLHFVAWQRWLLNYFLGSIKWHLTVWWMNYCFSIYHASVDSLLD